MALSITDDMLPVYNIHKWGRAGWNFMLACAFVYPMQPTDAERSDMAEFLRSISRVLPCGVCRHHFSIALDVMTRQDLNSRVDLVKWIHMVQNDVRQRKGEDPTPLLEFLTECTKGYKGVLACTWRQLCLLFAVIATFLLVLLICRYRKSA